MADEPTPAREHAPRFRVPRIPGDIMIYPMVIGLLLNTFCPQLLDMGGFLTAVIVTALVAPVLTGLVDRRLREKGDPRLEA